MLSFSRDDVMLSIKMKELKAILMFYATAEKNSDPILVALKNPFTQVFQELDWKAIIYRERQC